MTENNKYEPGCYGDCSFGYDHTRRKVFEIALSDGWDPMEDRPIVDRFINLHCWDPIAPDNMMDDAMVCLEEIEDEAIDYLNEHCSDDTHYWGYENGDFGYWECEEE